VETQLKQAVAELQVRQGLMQRSQFLVELLKYLVVEVQPQEGGA
jgi:hypothetical protein